MQPRARVAVVGGGVSGLATAFFLRQLAMEPAPEVVLIEAESEVGGKIATRSIAGMPIDVGPDTLGRRPELMALLTDLELDGLAVEPANHDTRVWSRGKLRALPPMIGHGIPDETWPVLRSGLLSPAGVVRAALDVVLPRRSLPADPSIGELLRPRFGNELFDRLVAPILGGMQAGPADSLSAASTVPDLHTLAVENRSLYLALRRRRRNAPRPQSAAPAVLGLDSGLERLVRALAGGLGTTVRTRSRVTALQRADSAFRLTIDGAKPGVLDVDCVVLATPAFVTADLLSEVAPAAAATLRDVPYVDVVVGAFAYPAAALSRVRPIAGFFALPTEGRLLTSCAWVTAKWPRRNEPSSAVLRVVVTGQHATTLLEMDDKTVVARLHAEVAAALQLAATPSRTLLRRLPKAVPQYVVGHGALLRRLKGELAEVPGLQLTGAAYRGASVAACVAHARSTAEAVLAKSTPDAVPSHV